MASVFVERWTATRGLRRRIPDARGLILLITIVVWTTAGMASEPPKAIPSDLVLERFTVAKGGDALTIPVRVGGKDRRFVVDTGSTHTLFDAALSLGTPRGATNATTAGDQIEVNVYDPPVASVGTLPFRVADCVGSLDLKKLREVGGQSIEGVLAMDFLGQYVVHLDFDRGELLFLKSAPEAVGDVVPMNWEPGGGPPIVSGFLTGADKVPFIIDTGGIGFDSGSLNTRDVRDLVVKEKFRKVGLSFSETASGTSSTSNYQGSLLALGGFSVTEPVFSENPQLNLLGLGFWSRFVVTFDFPGRRIFLSKAGGYTRPDRWNLSGLHLLRKGDAVVVDQVDGGSPGLAAGIQAGDVLLKIGELNAGEASLFEMRSALCREGRRTCVVRRGGQDRTLSIRLSRFTQ